jgi:1-deoxy-D-xylulose-5-phosphate synthase
LFINHDIVITIEEHSLHGGLGSAINNFIIQNGFQNLQVHNFGIPDIYLEQGSNKELCAEIGLTAEAIAEQILQKCDLLTRYANEHDHSHLS